MNVLELQHKLTAETNDDKSLLVIERAPERLRHVAATLQGFGHEVVTAATVREATAAIDAVVENQTAADILPLSGVFIGNTLPPESVQRILGYMQTYHLFERGGFTILTDRRDITLREETARHVDLQPLSPDLATWAGSLAAFNQKFRLPASVHAPQAECAWRRVRNR